MKTGRRGAVLAITGGVLGIALKRSTAGVTRGFPFTIEASEDVAADFPGAPRLQSFAWAQWDGKWIFIAGRTGGYHGIGQGDVDFPRTRSNLAIWVIEPPASGPAKIHSLAVADLHDVPTVVKDQWVSSNLLHCQDHETLYLAGGYGVNSAGDTVTYPVLSAVNLPALVKGVIEGKDTFSKTIAYVESPLVQSTGGELVKLDDGLFYLVGGHVFMGSYRAFEAAEEKTTPKASQTYLGEIRKLKFTRAGGQKLEVSQVERYQDPELARRDLNVALTIGPDGKLGAAAYGGVFTKDQLNFTHPVYFQAGAAPQVDAAFEQKMSAYSCATLLMYDPGAREMYTTFFGGISRWTWNYASHQFEKAALVGKKSNESGYLDGMPWIDHITTLVKGSKETYEYVQSNRLPSFLGTNAAFMPVPGLKEVKEGTGIFDVDQFRGKKVLAGYIYGGIRASPKQFPYTDEAPYYTSGNVPTKPSDVILKVYVTAAER
ncbi:MAG TPA: hypothetical protein VKR43_17115 [Bryobacteraceae bacterium]|nr:hypothetical protein [Bryobacteraceae bacterium]